MRKLTLAFLFILCSKSFADQTFRGAWGGASFTSKPEENHFFYQFKEETRVYNKDTLNEQVLQTALAYMLPKKISLWMIYQLFQRIENSKRYSQSIAEQIQFNIIDKMTYSLVGRNRFEQRFNALVPGTAYRDRVRANLTLHNAIAKGISPIIYDELFFNVNHPDWVSQRTLSQNRVFGGVRVQLGEITSVLIGYLGRSNYETRETIRDNLLTIELEVRL